MLRLFLLCALTSCAISRSITLENATRAETLTSTYYPTQMTSAETSTFSSTWSTTATTMTTFNRPMTTTTSTISEESEEATTMRSKQSYRFQSNFSRNNDSVFVSLQSNISEEFVLINNTFTAARTEHVPCEIMFSEYTRVSPTGSDHATQILIHFNGSFTHNLASQLGDRLIDIADLLMTVRLTAKQNATVA